ncbi:MAG: hypothetical protein ACRCVT_06660 [Leadbetterella sp.]
MNKLTVCLLVFAFFTGYSQDNPIDNSGKSNKLMTIGVDGTGSLSVSSNLQSNNPRTRTFTYHLSSESPDCNRPLLIVLHDTGSSGNGIKAYAGFDGLADVEDFLIVYPNALNTVNGVQFNNYADNFIGNVGDLDPDEADDVKFISDLIDYFFYNFGIDRSRVYVTGHGSGGTMAYHLALADLTKNKIAAIAPVGAKLFGNTAFINGQTSTANYSPTAILHVHGTTDVVVDPPVVNTSTSVPFSTFATPQCGNPAPVTTVVNSEISRITYCSTGKKIQYMRLTRLTLGHQWPTGTNSGYFAASEIWDFINTQSKGSYVGTLADPVVTPTSDTVNATQTVTLTASNCPPGTTYSWRQGSSQVSNSSTFISPALASSVTYTVYCVKGGCQSAGISVPILVLPNTNCPQNLTITGNSNPPPYSSNIVYRASNSINVGSTSNPLVLTSANSNRMSIIAGKSINFSPGVTINSGTVFRAEIASCPN